MARPRLIDQQQIVAAALAVLDADGPDHFTLAGVAERLGVTTPALYNHFSEKNEILREAARQVFGPPDLPRPEHFGPDRFADYIVARSLTSFRQASAHPGAAILLLSHIPLELVDAGFQGIVELLAAAGVDEKDQLLIFEGAQKLVWGWVLVVDVFDRTERAKAGDGQHRSSLTNLPALDSLELLVRAMIRGVVDADG